MYFQNIYFPKVYFPKEYFSKSVFFTTVFFKKRERNQTELYPKLPQLPSSRELVYSSEFHLHILLLAWHYCVYIYITISSSFHVSQGMFGVIRKHGGKTFLISFPPLLVFLQRLVRIVARIC